MRREELNLHLRDQGLFFPIDPGANATIGGMASTRASGTNAVRYGTMREAVLALTVVTPDGKVIRTATRARKSAAGYDLTRLFVGSEGTLGIITEVTLRLHPIPETISSAVCGFDSLQGAVDTVVQSIQCGVPLARVEILDDKQMARGQCLVEARLSRGDDVVLRISRLARGRRRAGDDRCANWRRRTAAASSHGRTCRRNARSCGRRGTRPITPPSTSARARSAGRPMCACRSAACPNASWRRSATWTAARVPATILGHVGDGNFHVIFAIDPDSRRRTARGRGRSTRAWCARALAMEGTCTGEHGIGLGKQDWLVAELGDAVDMMRDAQARARPAGPVQSGQDLRALKGRPMTTLNLADRRHRSVARGAEPAERGSALLTLALAMLVGFVLMGSFSTVQEGAKAELGLSDVTLALIQGVGAAVPLVLFSIPIGILVDRCSRMRLMAAAWRYWRSPDRC